MSRVDGPATLIQITPARLESLMKDVKKKATLLITLPVGNDFPEVEINKQDVKIRKDWDSEKWKENAPRGWAWRQKIE